MAPYFILFFPIALIAALAPSRRIYLYFWAIIFFVIVVFVGLRHNVGIDWNNYLLMIERANLGSWIDSFQVSEPGYATLLWVSGQRGWGVYGAYFIGTFIFAAGLFRYARTTPYPWIALAVAMPNLVIVVSMSAARQAVAIGVLLWLVAAWPRCSLLSRIALVLFAASFHISAVAFLFFVVLDLRIRFWLKVVGTTVAGLLAIYILTASGHAEYYDSAYGTGRSEITQSSGAIIHTFLNAGPALLAFALGRKYWKILLPDTMHRQLAVLSIAVFLLVPVSSAAAGRIGLYLFPVSMMIFSSLPLIVKGTGEKLAVRGAIAGVMFAIMTIWLVYANSAGAHQNYRNALFVDPHILVLCCR